MHYIRYDVLYQAVLERLQYWVKAVQQDEEKEWGKGYASAITKRVIEESGSSGKELVIECSPEQKATKRIAKKYGFQFCSVVNGCEVYRLRRK